jgi:hypothetical protein
LSSRAVPSKYILIPLLLITPLGFLFKFYSGPGRLWFNNYGAGLLYELFWILIFFFIFPGRKAIYRIPLWVFGVTCALECLQLFHPPFLEKIRATFLGKALIGTTFVWWDFPHYAVGCLLGWRYLKWIGAKCTSWEESVGYG